MLHIKFDEKLIQELKELQNETIQTFVEVSAYSDDAKNFIKKIAHASTVGGSTRIENAQLTDSEIYWIDTILETDSKPTSFISNKKLIENKLSKDRERSIEEVAGCRQMLHYVFDQHAEIFPLQESHIRALHYELMSPYLKEGPYIGTYKIQSNSVVEQNLATKTSRTVFQTADAGLVTKTAMDELVSWYNKAIKNEPWAVAVACEFVYRFLAIHPFQDGNGRLGRGLFLLSLLQSKDKAIAEILPYISIDRQIEKHREEYYLVLNKCSGGKFQADPEAYRIEYFLKFMVKIIRGSLKDVQIYQKKYESIQTLSESATKIYECFKNHPEIRLTRQKIVELTMLSTRTITYSLNQLTKLSLIQKYGLGGAVRYQLTF